MKKLRAFLLTSSALLCFSLVSCGGHNDGTEETVEDESLPHSGDYTLMIYMCASTLESEYAYDGYDGAATADIKEMLSINIPDNINVVLRTGGTSSWGPTYSDKLKANYIQTFRIKNKQLVEVKSQRKQYTSDSVTMSDKTELKNFVDFCKTKYPSSKNALILWDHGGGMEGVCQDAHYYRESYPLLTNSDVDYALSSFTGDNKLEWIGYDACVMNVQDIASKNSKHAKYMISSQENEPGGGWCYDKWLPTLCNNPNVSTTALLSTIADTYVSYWKTIPKCNYITMSVLDLNYTNEYDKAWEILASSINKEIICAGSETIKKTNWSKLVSDIIGSNAIRYGADSFWAYSDSSGGGYEKKTIYPFNLIDTGNAIEYLYDTSSYKSKLNADEELDNLKTIMSNYVVKNLYDSSYYASKTPSGLSFFCPIENQIFYFLEGNPPQYVGYTSAMKQAVYSTSETDYTTWRNMCIAYGNWNK